MATHEHHIAGLIIQHLKGTLSPQDEAELHAWMEEEDSHRAAVEPFFSEEALARGIRDHWVEDKIWQRLNTLIDVEKLAPVRRLGFLKYVAAASLLAIIVATYMLIQRPSSPQQVVSQKSVKQDIAAPKQARAILTLASGRQIAVDSVATGTLASEGNIQVIKRSDGQLTYTGKGDEVLYNTLTNPRGSGVIAITLADGTKAWLNAESSLHYPTAFMGTTRTVEITGEGYFEVARKEQQPFTVKKGNTEVTVLGTSFDINSYDDEAGMNVTLVDGAVEVIQGTSSAVLKPGQQAESTGGRLRVINTADIEKVMAWKNGLFNFDKADLKTVMRQLARWYDVDIVYENGVPEMTFGGDWKGS